MSQELLNQFLGLLEASNSFKLLDTVQQAAIRQTYSNATDEQLNQAIQALKEDQLATQKLAEEAAQRQGEIEQKNTQLKNTLRKVEHDERQEAEAADNEASEKEMAGVLQQINSMGVQSTSEPQKKKFMGLF